MICFAVELSWLCVVLCILTGMHMHMQKRRHIHIQIHVRSCAYTHTCTDTYTHTYTCTQTYTHTYTCIHAYNHTFIHSYIHTSIHPYIHTFIHSYIHTFIRSYIHTFIHSYVHTHITIQNNYLTTLRYVNLRYVTLHLYLCRTSRQPSDVGLPENPMVPQPLAHWAPPSWKRRWTSGSWDATTGGLMVLNGLYSFGKGPIRSDFFAHLYMLFLVKPCGWFIDVIGL